jgi:hypothetical protein
VAVRGNTGRPHLPDILEAMVRSDVGNRNRDISVLGRECLENMGSAPVRSPYLLIPDSRSPNQLKKG